MSDLILGGDTSTQFTFGTAEDYAASIERARLEQQEICGYELVLLKARQTHMVDDKGRDVYEVFATFGPKPTQETTPHHGFDLDANPGPISG